jgi:hypothetical protein
MPNMNYLNGLLGAVNLVQHSIVAYSNAPTISALELFTPTRTRFLCEGSHGIPNPLKNTSGQISQLLLGSP